MEHHKQEEIETHEIQPASPQTTGLGEDRGDVKFCNKLHYSGVNGLEW
jgi:hypothetical protein